MAQAEDNALQVVIRFGDAVLRGVGQVMFQNNPITGALFLLAILVNSIVAAGDIASQGSSAAMLFIGAILGTAASTAVAMLLGVDRGLISAGLYGFNGTLVGIAFPFFLRTDALLVVYIIVGAAFSSVIMAALMNCLGRWEVPALTAPFVFTTWMFLFALWAFGGLHGTGFLPTPTIPQTPSASAPLGFDALWQGLLEGVGEVMFQLHWIAGVIFLIGILVNSRISFIFAIVGSLVGLVVGIVMGGNPGMLGAGLYGFNPVLTGIALGGFFYVLDWKSALYTVLGAVVTTVAMGAIVSALTPLGMPALTSPFVFTTWLFIFAMSPSGGILQGDRYRLDITARAGSRVHITTQAATKIYRMERNYASQVFNLEVGADAYVEYLPDPTIPFRDARFYQETNLVVHRTGTLIYGEVILPGRVARGEVHAYRLYYNRTEAADEQGRLLFVDTVRLRPQTIPVQTPGLLGAFDVLGTTYVVTPLAEPGALAQQLYERLQGREALMAAASELPGGAGVIVRVLGRTSQGVAGALRDAWEHVRKTTLQVGLPPLRKY